MIRLYATCNAWARGRAATLVNVVGNGRILAHSLCDAVMHLARAPISWDATLTGFEPVLPP